MDSEPSKPVLDWTPEEHWRLKTLAKKKMSLANVSNTLSHAGSVPR